MKYYRLYLKGSGYLHKPSVRKYKMDIFAKGTLFTARQVKAIMKKEFLEIGVYLLRTSKLKQIEAVYIKLINVYYDFSENEIKVEEVLVDRESRNKYYFRSQGFEQNIDTNLLGTIRNFRIIGRHNTEHFINGAKELIKRKLIEKYSKDFNDAQIVYNNTKDRLEKVKELEI